MEIKLINKDLIFGSKMRKLSNLKNESGLYTSDKYSATVLSMKGSSSLVVLFSRKNRCEKCLEKIKQDFELIESNSKIENIYIEDCILFESIDYQRLFIINEDDIQISTWISDSSCTNQCLVYPKDPLPGLSSFYNQGSVEKSLLLDTYIFRSILNIDDYQDGKKDIHAACGISEDKELAKLKCLSESIERYVSAKPREVSYDAIPQSKNVSLEEFNLRNIVVHNNEIGWTPVQNVLSSEIVYIPTNLVSNPYIGRFKQFLPCDSTGTAAHENFENAAFSALLEVIERDAYYFAYSSREAIYAHDKLSPSVLDKVKKLKEHGVECYFSDITTDLDIPVIHCLLQGPEGSGHGASCRPNIVDAEEKALMEAIQTYVDLKLLPNNPASYGNSYSEHRLWKSNKSHEYTSWLKGKNNERSRPYISPQGFKELASYVANKLNCNIYSYRYTKDCERIQVVKIITSRLPCTELNFHNNQRFNELVKFFGVSNDKKHVGAIFT
ncbi:YcaO-like family protein [Vibrio parahaemolyticus]|uniref:YcaO-like family protein n=1 Tax=Vibrio parahaemolyticus TaxID=670 RepID=UPI00084ABA5D|nr:YcaO-like family protein [Vibrio parahaemolyticus]ODX85164.1 hypothetical protein BBM92_14270 [Vibrio parahaemolyticus]ODY08694.1 hypothetical protein BBM15_21105 [Vibrio parahaemolyticus]